MEGLEWLAGVFVGFIGLLALVFGKKKGE